MISNSLTLLASVLQDGAFHIDASKLEGRYMACPREFYYYALRRREAVRDFIGRDFGKFVHSILDDHYNNFHHLEIVDRAVRRWEEKPCTTSPDEYRNLDFALKVYNEYRDTYELEPFDVLTTEEPIALPIGSMQVGPLQPNGSCSVVPVLWTGRIDAVVRMHSTGKLWVLDHKTTSIGGETFWTQWVNSTQMHGYVWAAQKLLNEPIEGYIINALFLRRPTKTGKSIELVRQMFPITVDSLDNWHYNTQETITNIGQRIMRNQWPMHTHACVRKYGTCEFHEACRLSPGRESLLDTALFQDVTWSPLD